MKRLFTTLQLAAVKSRGKADGGESQEALGEDEALKVKLRGRRANQGDEEVEEREDVESIIEFETTNQAEGMLAETAETDWPSLHN
ncbi:hypothetical protein N7499_003786 [Penicillium canescens]|uniref:Uncharacterized protein n=1 Tax=Penicillium canescens TaxID=5083 RepID=A0AAD6N922_PENCN|nr:uncharacterized protein N7446_011814 [Penicillium canescens]KAJ5981554.1 hypothetical protein N7522_013590 [Penicillium canescens]KAJ6019915.1 hypothetical protein N7522_000623 [Penicillium canescens]KAJ6039247.1 hypothetical protein N7460_007279 [Penicillium canescens]KAJ6046980.1 hypothetical protein N7446_011814 [Penicillium canescens]KAJ6060923.1 hypothetical protein N7444_002777 [Penicillium canescens]